VFEGYIGFYSNLFGKEVKWVVRSTDVKALQRVKTFMGQRIMIKTADEELMFGGFKKCTRAFNCLSKVCNVSVSSATNSCSNLVHAQAVCSRPKPGLIRAVSEPACKTQFINTPSKEEHKNSHTSNRTKKMYINTVSEADLKLSHSRSGSDTNASPIEHSSDRKETKTESISDTSEQELFAGLDGRQTFPDYVDMNFNESQIRSPKEHEDLTFSKVCTIDLPINTVEFFYNVLCRRRRLFPCNFSKRGYR